MKPSLRLFAFAVVACLSTVSCNHLEYVGQGGDLVVEGWVMDGEFPIVIVSRSITAQEKEIGLNDLARYFQSYAVVSFSDGEQEIMLVGKKDEAFLPQYIYTTSQIRGETGKTYRITVTCNDKTVCAKSRIEKNVPFTGISLKPLDDGNYSMTASFVNDAQDSIDYRCFVWREGIDSYWAPSLLGTIDGRQDGPITFSVNPAMTFSSRNYSDSYSPGEIVHVRLCSMKRPMFKYWNAFENMQSFSRNPLIPVNANLPSLFDGAIGYWTGYGCCDTTVVIPAKR